MRPNQPKREKRDIGTGMHNYQPDWTSDEIEADAPPALRQALLWYELNSTGSVSEEMRADFEDWLMKDPQNARAYSEIDAIWQGARELPQFVQTMKRQTRARLTRRAFMAGGVLCSGALASQIWLAGHPFADLRTAKGELRHLLLDDGSRLEVAGRSTVSLNYTPDTRSISLHRGEAWFDMKKAQDRPYLIDVDGAQVRGTAGQFTLETGASQNFLTVAQREATVATANETVKVSSGQQLVFSRAAARLVDVDLSAALAWRQGRLVYVSQPLSRIVAGINRWAENQIIILNNDLGQRSATLIVDINDINQALANLQDAVPMRVFHAPGGMVFVS